VLDGEEGMWPFSKMPKEQIAKTYGIEIDDAWISQVQTAALRFSTGGSASFISPQGLVMTNHHVGARVIHNLSSIEKNVTINKHNQILLNKLVDISCGK
jgi:hypothetical protein